MWQSCPGQRREKPSPAPRLIRERNGPRTPESHVQAGSRKSLPEPDEETFKVLIRPPSPGSGKSVVPFPLRPCNGGGNTYCRETRPCTAVPVRRVSAGNEHFHGRKRDPVQEMQTPGSPQRNRSQKQRPAGASPQISGNRKVSGRRRSAAFRISCRSVRAGLRRGSLQTKTARHAGLYRTTARTAACESGNVSPCSLNPSAVLPETHRTL